MFKNFFFISIFSALVLFQGCSAHKVKSYETSGFMDNYAGLEVGAEDQLNLVYVNPSISMKQYDKILIDHVVVYFNKNSKNKGISPEKLVEFTGYFHTALIMELQKNFTIVSKPGRGVLHLRSAITDVEPGKPVQGTVTTIVPVGAAISAIKKTTSNSHIAVGRASVEFEILDSLSGQRIAAAVDRREGGKKGITTKWGDIEEAFDYWAAKLLIFLTKQRSM